MNSKKDFSKLIEALEMMNNESASLIKGGYDGRWWNGDPYGAYWLGEMVIYGNGGSGGGGSSGGGDSWGGPLEVFGSLV